MDTPAELRIVTWNVNSLNARREFVEKYLDARAPEVLCLQELKLPTEKVPIEIFEERGYHVAVHGQPRWNGVLIASKEPLEDVVLGLGDAEEGQARAIAATTYGIRLINVYCPQGQRVDSDQFPYKLRFYDALIDLIESSGVTGAPFALLGDLNIAPKEHDLYSVEPFAGTPSFHPEEHARLARLADLGLVDAVEPFIEPGTFSFWDYRGGAFRFNRGMRIDHVLASASLNARVVSGWVDRDWRKKKDGLTASDHAPVGIGLGPA